MDKYNSQIIRAPKAQHIVATAFTDMKEPRISQHIQFGKYNFSGICKISSLHFLECPLDVEFL